MNDLAKIGSWAKKLWQGGSDLFLGAVCPGCQRPGAGLCWECSQELFKIRLHKVSRADLPLINTWALHSYDSVIKSILISYKERGSWWLARPLARILEVALCDVNQTNFMQMESTTMAWLVPIPSRTKAVYARGEDVIWRLVKKIQMPGFIPKQLLLNVAKRDQSELSKANRQRNIASGLRVKTRGNTDIWVIDDIITTGSTLAVAQQLLAKAGYRVRGAVGIAASG